MKTIQQSQHLQNTHYELRGKVADLARALTQAGHPIMKLHLGNPGLFNMNAPEEILDSIKNKLIPSQAYCDSKGLTEAREAILEHWQQKKLPNTSINHIFTGNGVSELINISLQALLNPDDEVLLPQPVYPLWSAATIACGGQARYYQCDESSEWMPDINDIERQITTNTKAIVVINPNNPTGAVYPPEILTAIGKLAAKHSLVLFADEIYCDIIYDNKTFHHLSPFGEDTLTITFHGLSKNYLLAGYRCAWMIATGKTQQAKGYIEGINKLLSMRLCANVPAQYAIATALSDRKYTLLAQYPDMQTRRDSVVKMLNQIDGISCHSPKGAFYVYPSWNPNMAKWQEDSQWVSAFLQEHHILLAPGSTFAQPDQNHFRLVLLPTLAELESFCEKLARFALKIRSV